MMDNVGPDGTLNTDKMVRAMLMQRNTPDPACKLSPAQILFGRPLRDTLPYINKNFSSFNSPQISSQWRDMWRLKEETMRERYSNTLQTLSEHTRPLQPLKIGDHVFIQNQSGTSPRKWDHNRTVVESKGNDQYLIKVAGTGRLTLRNRRFLRQIKQSTSKTTGHQPLCLVDTQPPSHIPSSTQLYISKPADAKIKVVDQPIVRCSSQDATKQSSSSQLAPSNVPEALPGPRSPDEIPTQPSRSIDETTTPADSAQGALDGDCQQQKTGASSIVQPSPPRRSARVRKQRQFYDAQTGRYTDQNP